MTQKHFYSDRKCISVKELAKRDLLSAYVFMCTVKEDNKTPSVTIKQMTNSGYSRSAVHKYLSTLTKAGWAFKISENRYILKSCKKVIQIELGLEARKLKKFQGDSISDIRTRVGLDVFGYKIQKQHKDKLGKSEDLHESDYKRKKMKSVVKGISTQFVQGVGIATRVASSILGYKSPTSGSRVIKRLETDNWIKTKKNNVSLCSISEFSLYMCPEIEGRVFYDRVTDMVYLREMSDMCLTQKFFDINK